MSAKKERIDKLLVELGLVTTRARAQAMILAGHVLVNDVPVTKAGELVFRESAIRLREAELKYVSRGALKLKGALEHFQVLAEGKTALDVGASTGGFTEVLLEKGAVKVYAIDVGTNQLAWKLRSDPRVHSIENINARYLKAGDLPGRASLVVMDVSFISIRLILPAILDQTEADADFIILFKPQFELGREWIGEGGIVRDQTMAKKNLEETIQWATALGLEYQNQMESPIQGTDGNIEYLIHWKKRGVLA